MFQCGIEDEFFVMAFELLGPTLEDMLKYFGGQYGLKTTLLLADQMVIIYSNVSLIESVIFTQ